MSVLLAVVLPRAGSRAASPTMKGDPQAVREVTAACVKFMAAKTWRTRMSAGGAAIERRLFIAQSLYAFGALLCLVSTYWSIAFILLVQLNYAIP